MKQDTIDELLKSAVNGDTDALGRLLLHHDCELRSYIVRKLPSTLRTSTDEQDVIQVTYLEAHLRVRTFRLDREGSFQNWLRKMADNNLIDAIRAMNAAKTPPPTARVGPPANPDDSYVDLLASIPASLSKSPSRLLSVKEAKAIVESTLAKLPADYATVARLRLLSGLVWHEVASLMNRSVPAVGMLGGRAQDLLKELLGDSSPIL